MTCRTRTSSSPSSADRASLAATSCAALAKRGYRIRVACRRPDLAGHLQPFGVPGQIMPVQANVRYPASLAAACDGAYAVINHRRALSSGSRASTPSMSSAPRPPPRPPSARRRKFFIQMSGIGADAMSRPAKRPQQGARRGPARKAFPGAIDPAAVDRLRAGRQFLQPVRGPGPLLAGLAADRRR